MAGPAVTLLIKDYEHLTPVVSGDVRAPDIDLVLDRDTAGAIDRFTNDPSQMVGEISITKHLARLSRGDRSVVGIPVFPTRVFRHRAFYVRRDSGITSLNDLEGKRLGIDQWLASGSTWSRAAMREMGVKLDTIRWWVWSLEGAIPKRPLGDLPPNVQGGTEGRGLRQMLLDGELDCLVGPQPAGLMAPDSPIVRIYPNYREVERAYYQRTGFFPAHHIIGIRGPLFEANPHVARSLYLALNESKQRAHANRKLLVETTPWLQADIEESTALIGDDWFPYGVEPNLVMVQHICDELLAQGFLKERLDAKTVFTEFEEVMRG